MWLWNPKVAAVVAAFLLGRIDIAPELIKICKRESRCNSISIHERDAWLSRASWRGQVKLGHLDAQCQPYRPGWATRGPWGLSAASHWQYLPACYQPEWLDLTLVSALVAARKWLRRCDGQRTRRWC
jgi:hypothetical protein